MFSTLDKFIGLALGAVFLYLLLANQQGTQTIFSGLTDLSTKTFRTLQGR